MIRRGAYVALALCLSQGAVAQTLSPEDFLDRASGFSLEVLQPVAHDPSNRLSGDPLAISLGETLFNDTGLSRDGTVACATCHVTNGQMIPNETLRASVDRKFRTVMPVAGAAYQDFLFWDGRVDSLWAQAIGPIENPSEHGFTRAEAVAYVLATYGQDFAALNGDLSEVPEGPASPIGSREARDNWRALTSDQQDAINHAYASIGKTIAAYEETVPVPASQWDQWVESGDYAAIPQDVVRGFELFSGKARCSTCHTGPLFTDLDFHNTGLPAVAGMPPDVGRQGGLLSLLSDPFNCLGPYSDAGEGDCPDLQYINLSAERAFGTFRTPSLRSVSQRALLGHAGQVGLIEDMVRHYNMAPVGPHGEMLGQPTLSELVLLNLTEEEIDDLLAFLDTI